jgi:hypothetical protein
MSIDTIREWLDDHIIEPVRDRIHVIRYGKPICWMISAHADDYTKALELRDNIEGHGGYPITIRTAETLVLSNGPDDETVNKLGDGFMVIMLVRERGVTNISNATWA